MYQKNCRISGKKLIRAIAMLLVAAMLCTGTVFFPGPLSGIANATDEDAVLESLSLSGVTLTPGFNPDITEYTATVGYNVNSTTIAATTSGSAITVAPEDLGEKKLEPGKNVFTINLLEFDPDTNTNTVINTYTITVEKFARIDERDPTIFRSGETWKLSDGTPDYAGTLTACDVPGSYMEFTKYCSRIILGDRIGPGAGLIDIYLDGNLVADDYDLYSPISPKYQQKIFDSGNLAPGEHTIKIVNTGTKRPAATGAMGQLDYIDYIPVDVPVKSIAVSGENNASSITTKGGTLQMVSEVLPEDAKNKSVTWSVKNGTGSATISASGLLTAQTDGTVTVKATANDGSGVVSNEYVVNIFGDTLIPVNSITVSSEGGASNIDNRAGTFQMNAEVSPVDATDKSVIWSVTNGTGSAAIDQNGLLTAISDGTVTVKATAKDGSAVASAEYTVNISSQKISDDGAYLTAYFRSGLSWDGRIQSLHYAYSRDGLKWYELNNNNPVLKPKYELRDPFLDKGPDGKWRLVYTSPDLDAGGNNIRTYYMGYAESYDLIHWTNEKRLDLMDNYRPANTIYNVWAPEWTYDTETHQYVIYWCSTLNSSNPDNNKHYMATTTDWENFSDASLFFDPGISNIDVNLLKYNNKFLMFFKDESVNPMKIKQTWASKLTGSAEYEDPTHISSNYITPDETEAPEVFKLIGKNEWHLIYDYWAQGKYGLKSTTNPEDPTAWSAERTDARFPNKYRHSGIAITTEAELQSLLNTYSLEAQYNLEGTAQDSSKNNRNGTFEGAPVTTTEGGINAGYANMDGVDDAIRLADQSSSGFMHDPFYMRSVSMWFKADDTNGTQILYDEGGAVSGLSIKLDGNKLFAGVASGAANNSVSADFTDTSSWHHVAAVFREGELLIYLDNQLAGITSTGISKIPTNNDVGGIGRRFNQDAFGGTGSGAYFKGMIDQVKIYSVPLFAEDVADLYEENVNYVPGSEPVQSVTNITVSSQSGDSAITTVAGTLQMVANILPDNATNKAVIWSVVNGTGRAAISASGLLTAVSNGTVTVKAVAKDGSNTASNEFTVTISGQSGSGNTGPNILFPDSRQNKLFAWYKMNDGTESTVTVDSSGSENIPKALSGSFVPDGVIGGAMQFNGTGDYVMLNDTSTQFLKDQFAQRTISFWFKADSTLNKTVTRSGVTFDDTQVLFEEGGTANGFAIQINNDKLEAQVASNASGATVLSTVKCDFTDTSQWHNVTVVFDGNSTSTTGILQLYLDGNLKNSVTTPFKVVKAALNEAGIGSRYSIDAFGGGVNPAAGAAPTGFFKGMIDDFRIYNTPVIPVIMPETTTPVANVSLAPAVTNLNAGQQADITETVLPLNATNKNLIWSSSDTSKVTVVNGRVKAIGSGTATITATAADGSGVSGTCQVTSSTIPVTGLTLSKTSLVIAQNNTFTISAAIAPTNATVKDIEWASSDNSIATVVNGKITGVGDGHATITAITVDGQIKQTCEVEVIGATENSKIFIMPYFSGSINQTEPLIRKLFFAFSRDGIHWYELNNNQPIVELGDENLVRDPMIGKGPDGKWRLVFTRPDPHPAYNAALPLSNKLGYSESDDLINWSPVKELPVMDSYEASTGKFVPNSWAPEWLYDPNSEEYILYWSSTVMEDTLQNRQNPNTNDNHHYYCTTKDWVTFSEAKPLFNPGVKSIDASITPIPADTLINGKKLIELLEGDGATVSTPDNNVWFMFWKDETPEAQGGMRNRYTWSTSGPLGGTEDGNDPGNAYNENLTPYVTPLKTEGSSLFQVGNSFYIIYDYWWAGKFGLKITANPADPSGWSDESTELRIPFRARHCGITEIDQAALWELINHYNSENEVTFDGTVNNSDVVIEGDAAVKSGYVKLDGTDDGITINNTANSFFMRTVSMWVKANDTQKTQLLYNEGDTTGGLGIRIEGGKLYTAAAKEGTVKTVGADFSNTGAWHHVTVQYTDGLLQMYLDGQLVSQLNTGFQPKQTSIDTGSNGQYANNRDPKLYDIEKITTSAKIGIGSEQNSFGLASDYFDGYVGQVKIYSVPLLGEGVSELYESTKAEYSSVPDDGGNNGEQPAIPVLSITVSSQNSASTITTKGGTLQMAANILPENATDKTVTWAVTNGTGSATINASGLLTAVSDGTVKVKAIAKDGSNVVSNEYVVTVSGQSGSGSGDTGGNNGGDSGNGNGGSNSGSSGGSNSEYPGGGSTNTNTDNNTGRDNGGQDTPKPATPKFTDMDRYSWAKDAVEALAAKGIISGTSATTFNPGKKITRADFIVMLVKALKLDAVFTDNFADVNSDKYYYEAVGIAKKLGITSGTGNNRFNPKDEISRQDMMVLVVNALKAAGIELDAGTAADMADFKDAKKVAGYAQDAVAALIKAGVIKGSNNAINPGSDLIRAEAAAVIYQIYLK